METTFTLDRFYNGQEIQEKLGQRPQTATNIGFNHALNGDDWVTAHEAHPVDWNYSAPHGAGRLMSRSKAKEILSMDEYKNSMGGIYTTSVNLSTIDEAPQAYKAIDEIKRAIVDTVDIVDIIKPIYNFKASE